MYYISLFKLIYLNCALGAAPQQWVAAPDGAPDFVSFIFWMAHQVPLHSNEQSLAAPDGALYFYFVIHLFEFIWMMH
jgi:hypothetical protein